MFTDDIQEAIELLKQTGMEGWGLTWMGEEPPDFQERFRRVLVTPLQTQRQFYATQNGEDPPARVVRFVLVNPADRLIRLGQEYEAAADYDSGLTVEYWALVGPDGEVVYFRLGHTDAYHATICVWQRDNVPQWALASLGSVRAA
jgi:hypothetical protein